MRNALSHDLTSSIKIMSLNCGSSSIKYSLWIMPDGKMLCSGIIERISMKESTMKHYYKLNQKYELRKEFLSYKEAINLVINIITNHKFGSVKNHSEVRAVAHRVVHGGNSFNKSTVIDENVSKEIERLGELAPLHNPFNLIGIKEAMKIMPKALHVAIFDTAFFREMPPHSYIYGIPYRYLDKYGIRKYGFHGSSHLYVSRRASALLKIPVSKVNLIILHIGNGTSITAIKSGKAFDHSMGFTPLEGAIMGTRSGDIDPAILPYLMDKEGLTSKEVITMLNKESGILGITERYSDRRDVLSAIKEGDKKAKLALEIECYRLKKYIGAYFAALGHVDAIIFTAGVGESSPVHRKKICQGLDCYGIEINHKKNNSVSGNKEREISASSSIVKILIIPTLEELVFIEDAYALFNEEYDPDEHAYSFEKSGYKLSII